MVSWQVLGEQAVRLSLRDIAPQGYRQRLALVWRILGSLFVARQQGAGRQLGTRSTSELSEIQALEASWRNEPAFGLWRDREDIQDSVQWVRQLREREWGSNHGAIDSD